MAPASKSQAAREHIVHPLAPVFDENARVLVLGTMPSPASRAVHFYYGHPQNRFWRVLARLFDEPVPSDNDERTKLVLAHGIALWDVLASCDIAGAQDASIRNACPNDLARVIDAAPIAHVFTTGGKAASFYRRFDAERWPDLPFTPLPSTSAANARMSLDDLVDAYAPLAAAVRNDDR
jgi:hypoxanthine-DNA glycosylase